MGSPESLTGLLAHSAAGGGPLIVGFREEPEEHTIRLLETLGAGWVIDPKAPNHPKRPGRPGRTRAQMSDDEKERLRSAYYARSDKQCYASSKA